MVRTFQPATILTHNCTGQIVLLKIFYKTFNHAGKLIGERTRGTPAQKGFQVILELVSINLSVSLDLGDPS